ncbi:complex I NDUFA9 subunit family protein [Beggiatoa leptomitoformis]|uniref:NAD(P)H-binding protein n=1 Tax=Beggiatoa leptomitoformis TaxID=288004 RepID=A0A2N9YDI6_9GAMM|nr:complex I NDUFA9 subunit family protein [Beggiatoa leptomitoformis]ALG69048.1 NAD(P)H-binding protein [Beggiatoa leptomitoformis]AUI68543.1 NAD(P)H-binding protein [Beggiatoa leptomitoformis]
MRKICIVGGAGFVGKHLTARLANQGCQVNVLTRQREKHRDLLVLPSVKVISTNVFDQAELNKQLVGADAVVNLVGILNEVGNDGSGFRKAHVEITKNLLTACKTNKVEKFLYLSALNADAKRGSSNYLRTKGEAEDLILATKGVSSTIFRPSVIFGNDDSFFNRFANILQIAPVFPVPCPNTKFAPVWVNDVVDALVKVLDNKNGEHHGQRYNLCGPKVYSLLELVNYTARELLSIKRWIIPLSESHSFLQAKVFEHIPGKPYSLDNYLSSQTDSICPKEGNDFAKLGIIPTTIEAVMPRYFKNPDYRAAYSRFRHQAGGY